MKITTLLTKVKNLRNKEQNLKKAEKILENFLKKSSSEKEKLLATKTLSGICLDLGKIKKSEKYFKKGLKLAKKLKEKLILADLLTKYSYFVNKFHKRGDLEGLKYIEEILKICEKFPKNESFLKVKISALAVKGNILYDKEKFQESLKFYQEGLKLCRKIGVLEKEITLLGDIANIYISKRFRNFKKAEKILKETLLKATLHYKHSLPALLNRMGNLKVLENKLDEAQMWAELSLIVSKEGKWKREEAEALELLGKIFKEKNNFEKAKTYFKKALKIYKKLQYHSRIKKLEQENKKLK